MKRKSLLVPSLLVLGATALFLPGCGGGGEGGSSGSSGSGAGAGDGSGGGSGGAAVDVDHGSGSGGGSGGGSGDGAGTESGKDGGMESSSGDGERSDAMVPADDDRPQWEKAVGGGPGKAIPDQFYPGFDPEHDAMPEPRRGGRVIVHLSTQPKNMNYMIENSAVTRRMLRETHEMLVERDWETWEHEPTLGPQWVEEDTLVLKGGRSEDNSNIVYGKVEEKGDKYVVTPLSKGNPLTAAKDVPKSDVESWQRETVFTFEIFEGVKWHDGHTLDTQDIAFAFDSYKNPAVDCDNVRFQFDKMVARDVIDDRTIRIFFGESYFAAIDTFTNLTILPSHLYNLKDKDNPKFDADATDQDQGTFVNEHPNNTLWVGLGPYKVTDWDSQWVDAARFDDYHNQDSAGWVDEIRWRHIPGDDAAKQALINGELDYWERLRSEDYFGQYVKQPEFVENYYKGLAPYTYCGYTTWNMRRPKFSDPSVRRALNMCFDWESYIPSQYMGLASRVTSAVYYFAPFYNRAIKHVPFDIEGAKDLLADAGWKDRDGNGIIDKDGDDFVIEFMMPTGNKSSESFSQKYQENLEKVGIKMNIVTREWATFLERLYERDYDCANLAWVPSLESDPEQLWHSKWVVGRSSNHCGMDDKIVDDLIAKIQVELDMDQRIALKHQLQARVYDLQPYMFGLNQPKKIVVSKRIRNYKSYANDPGYRIRDWYIVE
ncbi:MAG: hypothetical protein GY711_10265 [bacterium]|nr:hypothetical protein [bacterium]